MPDIENSIPNGIDAKRAVFGADKLCCTNWIPTHMENGKMNKSNWNWLKNNASNQVHANDDDGDDH